MNQYEGINTTHTLITATNHLCEILLSKIWEMYSTEIHQMLFLKQKLHTIMKSTQEVKLHKTLSQIYLLCVHDNYPPLLHLFLQLGMSTSFVFKLKGLLSVENTQETIPTK